MKIEIIEKYQLTGKRLFPYMHINTGEVEA